MDSVAWELCVDLVKMGSQGGLFDESGEAGCVVCGVALSCSVINKVYGELVSVVSEEVRRFLEGDEVGVLLGGKGDGRGGTWTALHIPSSECEFECGERVESMLGA